MTFAWFWCFLALPLPWLIGLWCAPIVDEAALLLHSLPEDEDGAASRASTTPNWLVLLAWLLLIVAAARPQLPGAPLNLPLTGRSMMLAFDLSASMGTVDLQLAGAFLLPSVAATVIGGTSTCTSRLVSLTVQEISWFTM